MQKATRIPTYLYNGTITSQVSEFQFLYKYTCILRNPKKSEKEPLSPCVQRMTRQVIEKVRLQIVENTDIIKSYPIGIIFEIQNNFAVVTQSVVQPSY